MRRTATYDSYMDIGYEIMVSKRESDSFSDFMGGPFSHCLYLVFPLEAFPEMPEPNIEKSDWGIGRRIDYNSHPLSELDFHGGVTFMEIKKDWVTGLNMIKVGCDYQHLGDDHYASSDHTSILHSHAQVLIRELLSKFKRASNEEIRERIKGLAWK